MNKDNNLGRVLALLSLTLLMSFGLYSLPDTLFGYKIKKVDLLSDFKVKEEKLSLDSLKQQFGTSGHPSSRFGSIKGFYHAFRRNRFCGFGPS